MAGSGNARSVAIACQGGGSHAAFCGGALKVLLAGQESDGYRVAGLSGTSGGAICAALAWYGLAAGRGDAAEAARRAIERLDAFWSDNSAALCWEKWWNEAAQSIARAPFDAKWSPYAFPVQETLDLAATVHERLGLLGPRREFVNLAALLEKHMPDLHRVEFDDIVLLLGAVEVRSGAFKAFSSRKREISVDAVLASAALPTLFRAVRIDGRAYWDGLFSQNPPLSNFIADPETADQKPDEIWVLQVNPQQGPEPTAAWEIEDRRNELAGNLSLNQELHFIETVNRWLAEGRLQDRSGNGPARHKPVAVYRIVMDGGALGEDLGELDLASKLDRRADLIAALMAQGETQARLFLPVRRYLAGVWCETDPKARQARAGRLFADARGRRIPELVSLHAAYRHFVLGVEDLQIRGETDRRGAVHLRWSAHGLDRGGSPLHRTGRASFLVDDGMLHEVGITTDV